MKKVLMAFVICLLFSVSVQAKTTLPTDKTTAGEGCTLVGVEGEYITQAKEALKRINEIRYEACKEGVQDPRNTSRNLTENDYVPIKWSSDLEYIARIRAAEATVDQNGKITGVDYGTATITAKSGTLSQKITVNVTTHDWNEQEEISKNPTCKETGEKIFKCKVCGTKKTEAIKKLSMPKVGTVYTIAGNQYKVTKAGAEVSLIKANPTVKSITIPATIKANGLTYKVTTIAAKAFKQNKKLKNFTKRFSRD